MRVYEFENKNVLYHFMSLEKALDIFSKNLMPANWQHDIEGFGKVFGNSFTRNKMFAGSMASSTIRLTVSKTKLSRNNKIMPLDAEFVFSKNLPSYPEYVGSDRNDKRGRSNEIMAEEFVIDDIKNLNRILIRIEILKRIPLLSNELIKEYAKKYKIHFTQYGEHQ